MHFGTAGISPPTDLAVTPAPRVWPTPSDPDALHFVDAQEQAHALTGWNQQYLQLSAGPFAGAVRQWAAPGIRLFIETVGQSVFQTGALPPHVLAVGVPLQASGAALFCGRPCTQDDFHVFSGDGGFEFRTSTQHAMLGVELELAAHWLNPTEGLATPLEAGTRRLPAAPMSHLRNQLLELVQAAQTQPALLDSPAVVATVADQVLEALHLATPSAVSRADARGCGTPWALVKRACAHINAQPGQAPTVAQWCADLGVSRRTLQNAFAQTLGMSPLAYLKAVRLNLAKRLLKRADSVTSAATASGFWHFGHFAKDYRALFGEHPSATLRHYKA